MRDKVALVRPSFPADVKDPLVVRADIENQEPMVSLAVLSPTVGLRELTSLTDQTIVKGLENVPGVARVDVNGRVTRQILVQIKPSALTALGIGVDQVMTAISTPTRTCRPVGSRAARATRSCASRARSRTRRSSAASSSRSRAAGPVYLSQVADVIDGEKEETSIARINGRPSITIDIHKAQDANIVETGRGVRDAIEELRKRPAAGRRARGHLQLTRSSVETSVDRVKSTIIEGALLTVLIVFLFLHSWRSTIITGLTLPIAVIATFIALYAFGFTLNFMTLMALSLCIGLLIDDAIVVRENIVRHLGDGQGPSDGGARGDRRDRPRGDGDDVRDRRRVRADRVHERHHRPVLLPVRSHRRGRGAGVAVRELHARSDAVVRLARPAGLALPRVPWLGRFMDRVERFMEWMHGVYGRDARMGARPSQERARGVASLAFLGSFALVPLIGTEFVPGVGPELHLAAAQHAGRLEPRVHGQQGAPGRGALKQFPEIALAMTTVGTDEGRNYARINLKLTDRSDERTRSQKDLETRSATR